MQNIIETKQVKFVLLYQPLEEIEAEHHRIQKELQTLSSSRLRNTMTALWHRLTVVTTSAIAITTILVSTSAVYDAQSSVSNNEQTAASAFSALEKVQIVNSEDTSTTSSKASSRPDDFIGAKVASQRQWGPSLLMSEPVAKKRYYGFDPQVKQQQEYLMALGFHLGEADGFKGPGTRKVIAEFRALYLPDTAEQIQDADLNGIMESFATLAHKDAARYGIDQGVAAAIRLGSMRTGVDISYLVKLAATESSFNPGSKATSSSAAGLYQFIKATWLNTLKRHGAKYGIVADYAAKIRYSNTRVGPFVRDEALYQHLLDLRKNPRLAALMAAETVREHQQKLVQSLGREPSETDLYLAHFLGINNAIAFLQSLKQSPDMNAAELFPRAARSNHNIFQPSTCAPRTVDEVYALLDEKFSTGHYDEFAAN